MGYLPYYLIWIVAGYALRYPWLLGGVTIVVAGVTLVSGAVKLSTSGVTIVVAGVTAVSGGVSVLA